MKKKIILVLEESYEVRFQIEAYNYSSLFFGIFGKNSGNVHNLLEEGRNTYREIIGEKQDFYYGMCNEIAYAVEEQLMTEKRKPESRLPCEIMEIGQFGTQKTCSSAAHTVNIIYIYDHTTKEVHPIIFDWWQYKSIKKPVIWDFQTFLNYYTGYTKENEEKILKSSTIKISI